MDIDKELKFAWAAGFIDGEGCLYKNGSNYCLQVAQKDRKPLEAIKDLFGCGKIYHRENIKPSGKKSEISTYYLSGYALIIVLITLRNHFIAKSDKIEEIIKDSHNRKYKYAGITVMGVQV